MFKVYKKFIFASVCIIDRPLPQTIGRKAVDPMNRNETKVKRYSVIAVVALCAVLSSMFVMRRATKKMTNELLQFTAPATTLAIEAENEVDNVPDPRLTREEESTETTTAAPTTTTERETTQPPSAAPTTAASPSTKAAATVNNTHYILPISNAKIDKAFAPDVLGFSATMQDWRTHGGVDFGAEAGSDVLAVGNGKVTKVVSDPQWGYTVEIDHGAFTARYCALSQDGAVGIDAEVHTGDVIGTLAEIPMESADTPHLHFEVRQNGAAVDPIDALGLGGQTD